MSIKSRFIGDKAFYKHTIRIMLPIVVQNGITQFVNLLDNIMVGQIGTEPMTGVSITNQLIFVFNLCIFGALSGVGIFGAQFAGRKDDEGIRHTFRFKVLIAALLSAIAILLFVLFGTPLISLFLRGEGDAANIDAALAFGRSYLNIMNIGLVPFTLVQIYASTLRETGETVIPMKASVAAVLTNLVGNYILIFGKLGLPALGASGAAIATVASRFVELGIIAVWAHTHTDKCRFIKGAYSSLRIPAPLFKKICIKGAPILLNEALWSLGISTLIQSYSYYSYDVVAALNISQTINRLFDIITMSFGAAISIMVGQILGTGNMEKARETDTRLIAFSISCSVVTAAIMALLAPALAHTYKVTPQVQDLAISFLYIVAVTQPIRAFMHACYFTLRSGGRTVITFLFDSVFVWVASVPAAYFLTRYTGLHIIPIYTIVQLLDILKCIVGYILVKKGVWLRNIVAEEK